MPRPDAEIDPQSFCSDEAVEFYAPSLRTPNVNNLGGMGPGDAGTGRYAGQEVIAYECGIKRADMSCVDVVISAATEAYKTAHNTRNRARSAAESKFGRTSKAFIGAYNGNSKPSVAAIGALVPGEYDFNFNFYDSTTGEPVEIGYLPMTFYDLDGKNDLSGDRRYEVASTGDSEGVVSFKHSTLEEHRKLKHSCDDGVCIVESVTQEVEIPNNFDTLSPAEKSAAATFLFAHKSQITINYKLNYGHRVFLFKGSKSLYCDEFREQEETTTTKASGRGRFGGRGGFGGRFR